MFGNKKQPTLQVTHLNSEYDNSAKLFNRKLAKKTQSTKPSLYVLKFMLDSTIEEFRECVLHLINNVDKEDDANVLIHLDSVGGAVCEYGVLAEQLSLLRDSGFGVTIVVERVAASGGYMLACMGHKVIAPKFSLIGSVGVISSSFNFHNLITDLGIDYKDYTAGDYKRDVTTFGEVTEEAEEHRMEKLAAIHEQFKGHIKEYRPDVDVELIGTGECWTGQEALELGMIDETGSYDDVLMAEMPNFEVYEVSYVQPDNRGLVAKMLDVGLDKLVEKAKTEFKLSKLV